MLWLNIADDTDYESHIDKVLALARKVKPTGQILCVVIVKQNLHVWSLIYDIQPNIAVA